MALQPLCKLHVSKSSEGRQPFGLNGGQLLSTLGLPMFALSWEYILSLP